ncbi:MAG: hypothetical protein F4Z65_13075 [Acidobacteria bacterium]|nr:hypothetical protein [Acidobacteriota bacterium]MYA47432.1 hypothetical protein [Acidobacteriota bacterium]MYI39800.1 hypothetical protein [Acidobacteriota bacterium]
MNISDFSRIVTCFADRIDDVDLQHGELLVQIRDETITARLHQNAGDLIVEEGGERTRATSWIVNRIARIPTLADRICSYIEPPSHFVTPSGHLLDQPDRAPDDTDTYHENVVETLTQTLARHAPGTTDVVYLTSDAGEGKTSLIDFLAVQQAQAYRAKKSNWLLVPIALGGRTFLRFDDVVVSALVNRLRFQLLYYDAFLELVRLGVLVPAFDGFEEMIVEASSGEAVSALGNLVARLESAGTLLVAARKAYFDYPSFRSQARLFDSIGAKGDVAFGRVSLNRWNREAFCRYAGSRGVQEPDALFDAVASPLGAEHPVLTRAVLVKRLIDVATELFVSHDDFTQLVDRLGQEPQDYFHEFVGGLVEREARNKWLDTSGDPPQAILTTEEHHELLAMLALEMWLSATDDLRMDVVGIIVDMFAVAREKSPAISRQVSERIKQHALLVRTGVGHTGLAFDHEDFRVFYLGQAMGRMLAAQDASELRQTIEKAALPVSTVNEAVRFVERNGYSVGRTLALLQKLANNEMPASYVKENCGALTLAFVDGRNRQHDVRNMIFPSGALRRRDLRDLRVSASYFHATSLVDTSLVRCEFVNCRFERIELDSSETIEETVMDETCEVGSVVREDDDNPFVHFDPAQSKMDLRHAGFQVEEEEVAFVSPDSDEPDMDLRLVQRFLRGFVRANALNEGTIHKRLGVKARYFFEAVLPRLLEVGVVTEVPYKGRGGQKRLKLSVPMSSLDQAMSAAAGQFDQFVRYLESE